MSDADSSVTLGSAVSGTAWSTAGVALTAVMQLVFAAVASRLLTPTDFGVVSVAGLLLRIAGFVSQLGLGSAIVHVEELSRNALRTAITAAIGLGLIGAALGALLAGPISSFLSEPAARNVVIGQSLTLPLLAVSGVLGGVLRRDFRYRAVATTETFAYGVGFLGVGLILAANNAGPMSLVGGMAAASVVALTIQLLIVRPPVALGFDREEARPLLRFGARVSAISLFEAFTTNADVLAVGRYTGASAAGQYNRANQLASTPMQQGIAATGRVLLSYLSRIRDDDQRLRRVMQALVHLFATLLGPFVVFVAIWRYELIRVAFGPGWDQAAEVLPFVAAGSACLLLASPITIALEAVGLLRYRAIMQGTQLFTLAVGIGLAVSTRSALVGYAAAWMASEVVRVVGYSAVAILALGVPLRELLGGLGEPVLTTGLVGVVALVGRSLAGGGGLWMIGSAVISCAVLLNALRYSQLKRTLATSRSILSATQWRGGAFLLDRIFSRDAS